MLILHCLQLFVESQQNNFKLKSVTHKMIATTKTIVAVHELPSNLGLILKRAHSMTHGVHHE